MPILKEIYSGIGQGLITQQQEEINNLAVAVEGVGNNARKVQELDADPSHLKTGLALEEQFLSGRSKLLTIKRQLANLRLFIGTVEDAAEIYGVGSLVFNNIVSQTPEVVASSISSEPAAGIVVDGAKDLENAPDDEFDKYVADHTGDSFKLIHLLELTHKRVLSPRERLAVQVVLDAHGIKKVKGRGGGFIFDKTILKELKEVVLAVDGVGRRNHEQNSPLKDFLNPAKMLRITQVLQTSGVIKMLNDNGWEISADNIQRFKVIAEELEKRDGVALPKDLKEEEALDVGIEVDLAYFNDHQAEVLARFKDTDYEVFLLSLLAGNVSKTPVPFREMVAKAKEKPPGEFTLGECTLTEDEIFGLAVILRSVYVFLSDMGRVLTMKDVQAFSINLQQSNAMHGLTGDKKPQKEFAREMFERILDKLKKLVGSSHYLPFQQNPKSVHVLFEPFRRIKNQEDLEKVANWCWGQYQRSLKAQK